MIFIYHHEFNTEQEEKENDNNRERAINPNKIIMTMTVKPCL